ncbi:MAG: SprT family zinc-dependent metalloprotease [Candidatus Sulfotelmatobacter sp.]
MSTETQRIEIRGLQVEIVRKDIRNLHVGVYPPLGRVRVAAPSRLSNDAVRLAVISRLGWVRQQQAKFQHQERQSQREMVSGETHFVQGRRYRLAVIKKDDAAKVVRRTMRRLELFVRPGDGRERRQRVLDSWYRELLRQQIAELLAKWEPRIGVQVREWGIRKMKTRWGTCNREAGRIWVNLELAKKPPSCLEFIVVHELVHLIERRHNDRFRQMMDQALPAWREFREVLNRAPLSHQSWRY